MALLTVSQAAEILGVNHSRVRQYCISGALPARKERHGPQEEWRILESVVRKFKRPKYSRRKKINLDKSAPGT